MALRKLAESNAADDEDDKEWAVFAQTMQELVQKLQDENQPKGRAAAAEGE